MHKRIMKDCAEKLDKDASGYAKKEKHAKTKTKKKHEAIEKKEAKGAAKDLKSRARKAHEY